MFLGVVLGWSDVLSFSRQTVLNPCRQYLSNLSSSLSPWCNRDEVPKVPTSKILSSLVLGIVGDPEWIPLHIVFCRVPESWPFTCCHWGLPRNRDISPVRILGRWGGVCCYTTSPLWSPCWPRYRPLSSVSFSSCSPGFRSIPQIPEMHSAVFAYLRYPVPAESCRRQKGCGWMGGCPVGHDGSSSSSRCLLSRVTGNLWRGRRGEGIERSLEPLLCWMYVTLHMSLSGRWTVVCSYKDFNRSTSGISYVSRIAHSESWLIELKTLLKSMSTRRNRCLNHWSSLVRLYSL